MHGGPTPQHTGPKRSAANIPRSCVRALMNQRWHKEELAECAACGCSDVADQCTSHLNPANGECEADFNFLLKGSYWLLKQLLHVTSTCNLKAL